MIPGLKWFNEHNMVNLHEFTVFYLEKLGSTSLDDSNLSNTQSFPGW